jgi:hypothetical protein
MPAEAHEGEVPVAVVLRMLGEYSEKATKHLRRRWLSLCILWMAGVGAVATIFLSVMAEASGHSSAEMGDIQTFLAGSAYVFAVMMSIGLFGWLENRSGLELSVWQLRKAYDLASRIEDVGTKIDFAYRVELELRLSEAQFLLNRSVRLAPRSQDVVMVIRRSEMPGLDLPGRQVTDPV